MPGNTHTKQGGEYRWEDAVDEKLDLILSNQSEMGANLKAITELVHRIRSTVYGNGQEGLVTKVAVLTEKIATHTEEQDDGKRKMPDWVEKLIIPAVGGFLAWFLFVILPQLIVLLSK